MPGIRARLRENLDSTVTQLVVFRGKGILVNADFANGSLRRELSARKTVNIDLTAVGPGGRAGQRLQVLLQFVRIVGKSVEVLSGKHDGAGIALWSHVDASRIAADLDLFFLHKNLHGDVQALRLAGSDLHPRICISVESLGGDLHGVGTGGEVLHFVDSVAVRGRFYRRTRGWSHGDLGATYRRSRRVSDLAAQSAGPRLRESRSPGG